MNVVAPPPILPAAPPLLIADLFCGAGGTSTGAMQALRALYPGRPIVLVAVNHWPVAVATHQLNHPEARHYCEDIMAADPRAIVPEGRLDLLMASPTCTFHSRARGGKPVRDQQRMDPWWIVDRWLKELHVDRLLIENVPEFVEWGPCDEETGKRIMARKGEYFRAWVAAIEALGYLVEWRIINCADHGDATTRKRFFLQARRDGQTVAWPPRTHAPRAKAAALGLKPWRAAREVIDWTNKGRSIFKRKRPLKPKTQARIEAGIKKFCGVYAEAFLVVLRNHSGAASVEDPLPTLTAGGGHVGLVETFILSQASGGAPRSVEEPVQTIPAGGAHAKVDAFVTPYYGGGSGLTGKSVDEPLDTVTAKARFGLVETVIGAEPRAFIVGCGGRAGQSPPTSAESPLGTITAKNDRALVEPVIAPAGAFILPQHSGNGKKPRVGDVEAPVPTVTAISRIGLVQSFVMPVTHNGDVRTHDVDEPLPTMTCANRGEHALIQNFIVPQFGERPGQTPRVHDVDAPLPAVTSHGAGALVTPFLVNVAHQEGDATRRQSSIDDPVPTVTTANEHAVVQPVVFGNRSNNAPRDTAEPLPTNTTAAGGGLCLVEPVLGGEDGIPITINGQACRMDVLFRMLQPGELAGAMSFTNAERAYEFKGNKTEITRQIGNAVPVETATDLVTACFAETMRVAA